MNEAKQRLVEENQNLAYKFGNKMWWSYLSLHRIMELEDFLAEAMVSLVQAAEDFDPAKGFRFSTFAYHVMNNHFLDLWRLHKDSLYYTFTEFEHKIYKIHNDNLVNPTVDEFFAREEEMFTLVEILEDFSRFLQTCDEKEKTLLRLLMQGHTQKECAFLLVQQQVMPTCSQPAISSMIKKMTRKVNEIVLY